MPFLPSEGRVIVAAKEMTYRSTFKLTECGVLSESPMDGWLRWWAMSAGVVSDGARSGPTLARLVWPVRKIYSKQLRTIAPT
jgi:hypothetical protein